MLASLETVLRQPEWSRGGLSAIDGLLMSDQPSRSRAVPTLVEVTGQPLELTKYTAFVADPGAGAIATFTGTTRDTFQGNAVLRLEYEAYGPMAEKVMRVRRWLHTDITPMSMMDVCAGPIICRFAQRASVLV